ncbi:hypothetical protein BH10BAC6_BH10BAC6_11500 [soil metagenome]
MLLLALMVSASDSTYELNVGRRIKPTDNYVWVTSVDTREQHLVRFQEGPPSDSIMHLRLNISAMVEVVSVTADGEEHEKLLTIRNCSVKHNDRVIDLLPTGSVIRAIFTAKGTQLILNNRPMPDSVVRYIGASIHAEGGDKTKRILDPGSPKKLQQTWDMNTKSLLSLVDRSVVIIDPKSFTGIVTFHRLDTVEGRPNAFVIGSARADKLKFPAMKGVKLDHSILDMIVSVNVPLDKRYPETGNSSYVMMGFDGKVPGPNGKSAIYAWNFARTQVSTFER